MSVIFENTRFSRHFEQLLYVEASQNLNVNGTALFIYAVVVLRIDIADLFALCEIKVPQHGVNSVFAPPVNEVGEHELHVS